MMRGYCGKPEWADEEPCPLDTGEYDDCVECSWFVETEEAGD